MTMTSPAADLAGRLAENAEAVCRYYLSNGRRQGRYWIVGDVMNSRGGSLFVRLHGPTSGKGAAGKWTDAGTGQHGDLLDLIRLNRGHLTLREALEEARAFLNLPKPEPAPRDPKPDPAPRNSPEAARRLFRAGKPVAGTLAAVYLAGRGLGHAVGSSALRFHPRCYHRVSDEGPMLQFPALLAAVTRLDGTITGVSRTWLAPDGNSKADLDDPRRALGTVLGGAVRFSGAVRDVLVAGEGLETVLSLCRVLPRIPMAAGTSASHLAAIVLPSGLRCLYVARDRDPAGVRALETLRERAGVEGIPEVRELAPLANDFNVDLTVLGPEGLAAHLAPQLDSQDAARHLCAAARGAFQAA